MLCVLLSESASHKTECSVLGLKRSAPRPIISSKAKDHNKTKAAGFGGGQGWIPRVAHLPPDPVQDGDKFKTYVSYTICRCGIHEHTWTCRKPPKGWRGCRLCYPKECTCGTKPIELESILQPDGKIEWNVLESREKSVSVQEVDGSINTVKQAYVCPYDPSQHKPKANLLPPIRPDCGRTVVWELDRPSLDPLPSLDADMTKGEIISRLYEQMLNVPSVRFEEGCKQFSINQVDIHQFNEDDKNNLFYNLLLGLVDSSQVKPGDKSVQCLRREFMQYLSGKEYDYKVGDKTLQDHIKSRMDLDSEDNQEGTTHTSSIQDRVKQYTWLMECITGDDCFEGGELEVYLFAKTQKVNVAIYRKEKEDLIREKMITGDMAEGCKERPTIHLLRATRLAFHHPDKIKVIKSPDYKYTLFTPKLKGVMDKLQTFDSKDLRTLYKIVSSHLVERNGWVVDFNPLLTSLIGINSNLLHLGSIEQSKAALFYIGPYINKDGVKIKDALPLLLKAQEHALNYPSVAEDSGTNKRHVQHTLTRALNQFNSLMEVTDTQAAVGLLGMGASLCSESFVNCDTEGYEKFVSQELQRTCYDSDSDEEDEYYNEADIIVGGEDAMGMHRVTDTDNEEDESISWCHSLDDTCCDSLGEKEKENDLEENDIIKQLSNKQNEDKDDNFNYINASSGPAPLYTMNDGTMKPVSYAALYRYRGEALRHMNRYQYTATVKVEKNEKKETRDSSTAGRKKSKAFQFGAGLGIEKNYHQVLRSKQCIPKFKRSPPPPPAEKPQPDSELLLLGEMTQYQSKKQHKVELARWRKKADKFASFYLTMFRPEDTLYETGQTCTYEYNWETFEEFYNHLQCRGSALDKFNLIRINRVIHSWRVDTVKREMLAAFRGRNRTMWSSEQKEAAKSFFGHGNCKAVEGNDGMDCISSALPDEITEAELTNAKKHTSHSDLLLDTFNAAATIADECCGGGAKRTPVKGGKHSSISNVVTCPFNSELDTLKRVGVQHMDSIDELDDEVRRPNKYCKIPDPKKKVDEYIEGLKLSPDKDIALKLARGHFEAIRSGKSETKGYEAPLLLISGKPGNGKSKIIEAMDGITSKMKVGDQMKCAYMGAAAVNIGGTTFLKSWNVPVFNDGEKIKIQPWNQNRLQALKRRFGHDIYSIAAVVIDEVSTLQPYMLAYLNDRLQEMFQVFDKPFGGRMVILVGDFQQKPPTAGGKGNTLPGSMMKYIEEKGKPLTEKNASELGPTQLGGYLFSKFRYIKLTHQHRSDDPKHKAVLNKMSETGIVTVKDLKNYKKLSSEDLASDDFRFATIIVTGNLERRQINARQSERWARFHGVNTIRWPRKRKEETWKGKPKSFEGTTRAYQNSCFWEFFVPEAKGYLNTYGINADEGLANGTEIKYHSLSFEDRDQDRHFRKTVETSKPGDTITIDFPPKAINVELFADFEGDTSAVKAEKVAARKKWLRDGKCSIVDTGRVVIPISLLDGSQIKYNKTYVSGGCTHQLQSRFGASQIEMKDHFPIEPAFSITVDKAQVSCK